MWYERLPTEKRPCSKGPAATHPGVATFKPSKELHSLGQFDGFRHKRQSNLVGAVCGVSHRQGQSRVDRGQLGLLGKFNIPKPLCLGKERIRKGLWRPKLHPVRVTREAVLSAFETIVSAGQLSRVVLQLTAALARMTFTSKGEQKLDFPVLPRTRSSRNRSFWRRRVPGYSYWK